MTVHRAHHPDSAKKPGTGHHEAEQQQSTEEAMDEGLAAIYGEERDDLAKLDRGGSRLTRWLMLLVIALAVIAILAYGSFFIYSKFIRVPVSDPLAIWLEVPTELISGQPANVVMHYRNDGRVPLASLRLDANLPSALTAVAATPMPTDTSELIWNVGSVAVGEEGEISLQGMWLAEVPSTTSVQVLATYRPANFNADFDAVANTSIATLQSTLTTAMTGPEEATPGEVLTYQITVTNTSETTMTDVAVEATLPSSFFVSTSSPAISAGMEPRWEIAELASQATSIIVISGSFASDTSDVQQILVSSALTVDGDERKQSEASAFVDVVGNGLSVQLVANGSAGDVTLDPGDPLRLTIGYENTGEADLTGVSLLVDFQAEGKIPITWSEASLDGGRLTADGIRYDATQIGTLAPQDKKTKNLIFTVRDELTAGESQSWTVTIQATVGDVTIRSQPLTVTLNSDTSFSAQSRYYTPDGAPVGVGPLPPKVGEMTTYELVWTIGNALHALEDVRISATLPASAEWGGTTATDMGVLTYDQASRTISWNITDLPVLSSAATATFTVQVTPEDDDIGEFVKLLSGSAFRSTDSVTNSSIQLTAGTLSTECEGDTGVEGKGYVEE